MEYVVGKTLAEICHNKALPVKQCLAYATQIAAALAAAHRASIIHRDLKPGNIVVGTGGRVKLLDFGLAKLIRAGGSSDSDPAAETITVADLESSLTESGQIVGTVSYMSPEQLAGARVDARTDIFSFGVLLYEIVTGHHPFHRPSVVETGAEILKHEPRSPRELVPAIPRPLERIISHCLQKNPDERLQSITDVGRLLEDVRADLDSRLETDPASVQLQRPALNRNRLILAGVGLLLLGAVGYSAWHLRSDTRNDAAVLTRLTFDSGLTTDPAISSDGRMLAFASDRNGHTNLDIWVRQLAGGEPLQITRDPADDYEPDFSPDGTQIVYRSNREGGGIYLTSSLGVSEPQLVARNGHSPRFSPDGKWITYYVGERSTITNRPMRSKLFIIERATGQVQQLAPQLLAACAAVWSLTQSTFCSLVPTWTI